MIVVCRHRYIVGRSYMHHYINLTVGKRYEVEASTLSNDTMFRIVDDSGQFCYYPKDNFYTLEEYRDRKLDKMLGI